MKNNAYERGFIRDIVIIIVALIVLSMFGVDLQEQVKNPLIRKNLEFTWSLVQTGWEFAWNSFSNAMTGSKTATTTLSAVVPHLK